MKQNTRNTFWPSIKYEIKDFKGRIQQLLQASCFWEWKKTTFSLNESNTFAVSYLGKTASLPTLKALLGARNEFEADDMQFDSNQQVSVYAFPMPFTLRVPLSMTTMVKLDKSLEDIVGSYSKRLRKSINNQRPDYRHQMLDNAEAVAEINENMLKPYAVARHDIGANVLDKALVTDMALKDYGQLDVLYEGNDAVGCHLGNSYTRRGETFWHVNRLGYTEAVFSDHERWADINSMNLHLALEHSINQGYDYCDYGMSLAKAGGGLLEWKRRRKGFLAREGHNSLYLKPPKKNKAQFFWDAPIFSLQGDKVNLHLGVPADKADDEVIKQYRGMAYDGLNKVHLQCANAPSETLLDGMNALYKGLNKPPKLVVTIDD